MTKPVPFELHVPDADIADLGDRLARSRFPDSAPGEAWAYGSDVAYMRSLVDYWRERFDWRAEEAALNAFPQFRVPLDGIDLHYLHVEGKGPEAAARDIASARLQLQQGFTFREMGFRGQFALQKSVIAHVRLGSKADIVGYPRDVRFTPNSGHQSDMPQCPLCAKSRHWPTSVANSPRPIPQM